MSIWGQYILDRVLVCQSVSLRQQMPNTSASLELLADSFHPIAYTYSTTRSIGTTWTIGGFLGINLGDLTQPLGSAGFSATFSETTTVGSTAGSTEQCGESQGSNGMPGNWTCGERHEYTLLSR
jgi:hypothetical protein